MSLPPLPTLDTDPQLPQYACDVTLKMWYVQCLAAGTYVVAHEGFAFLIDPLRDVDTYVSFLEKGQLQLKGILLTHAHADYLGGHAELSRRTGAPVVYGHRVPQPTQLGVDLALARPRLCCHDGDILHLSKKARIMAMETPGHTPGCITYLLETLTDEAQWHKAAAFTGDTLFIGSCGRPDLVGLLGFTSKQMAGMMWRSLQRLARELPASCLILPAHGAGSPCGKALSDKLYDTMASQLGHLPSGKAGNPMLHAALKDVSQDGQAFVELLMGTSGDNPAPEYFMQCVTRNVGCATESLSDLIGSIPKRDCGWLAELQKGLAKEQYAGNAANTQIVDIREPEDFVQCHAWGSINVPLGTHGGVVLAHQDGNFGLWAGMLFGSPDSRLAVVTEAARHEETVIRLSRVGLGKHIVGIIDANDLVSHGEDQGVDLRACQRWTAEDIRQNPDLKFVDVRTPNEFACRRNGTVKGAVNAPLSSKLLQSSAEAGLAKGTKYVAFCRGGFRSAIASSMLRGAGYDVEDVQWGYLTFQQLLADLTTAENVVENNVLGMSTGSRSDESAQPHKFRRT